MKPYLPDMELFNADKALNNAGNAGNAVNALNNAGNADNAVIADNGPLERPSLARLKVFAARSFPALLALTALTALLRALSRALSAF